MTVAHEIVRPGGLWTAWSLELPVMAGLLIAGAAYAIGGRRLAGRTLRGRSHARRAACFFGGLAALAVALLSPLDGLGITLFSAHMVQHLVLVLIAAPLLVCGAPATVSSLALPASARRAVNRAAHNPPFRRALSIALSPLVVWLLHVAGVWLWHLPSFYEEALTNQLVHVGEHATFLGTALLFWAEVLDGRRGGRLGRGLRVVYVFTAALAMSALGAILTFATVALYPLHATGVAAWGLTLLSDQQLAGVIMWVPGGVVYLVVMTVLFFRWLREIENATAAPDPERAPLSVGLGGR